MAAPATDPQAPLSSWLATAVAARRRPGLFPRAARPILPLLHGPTADCVHAFGRHLVLAGELLLAYPIGFWDRWLFYFRPGLKPKLMRQLASYEKVGES